MKITYLFGGLFFLLISAVFAQDTVKIMQYNLLNYGNTTTYCTTTNNNINDKDTYIREIIGYIQPDILAVEEIFGINSVVENLLNNALNQDGRTYYQNAFLTNYSGSDLCNMLYYDARKFTLYGQNAIATSLRDINIYTLYYNSPDLDVLSDTVFLNIIVMHLKAGSNASDLQIRDDMTSLLMDYLNTNNMTGNNLAVGDFNVYTSSEAAFQNLVNYSNASLRFYDPVNRLGEWNNNSTFANYHTQSTHSNDNGCHASGGLDDRFDFILISNEIKNDLFKVKYVTGSYTTIAQDGNHYNGGLLDAPTNYSVPSTVLTSLYENSDHLPVTLQLRINQTPALGIEQQSASKSISFTVNNPASDNIHIEFGYHRLPLDIQLFSIPGQPVIKTTAESFTIKKDIDIQHLPAGIYFLKISDGQHISTKKILVNH